MYSFVDRHPSTLGNSGRFMLWAMRSWAAAVANKSCPPMVLRRAFDGVGASAALPDFHVANVLLHQGLRTRLKIASVNCCRIYEDEAVLLSIWHAVGREDTALVRGTLAHLARVETVRPVARAMAACTKHILLAGFDLAETQTTLVEEGS